MLKSIDVLPNQTYQKERRFQLPDNHRNYHKMFRTFHRKKTEVPKDELSKTIQQLDLGPLNFQETEDLAMDTMLGTQHFLSNDIFRKTLQGIKGFYGTGSVTEEKFDSHIVTCDTNRFPSQQKSPKSKKIQSNRFHRFIYPEQKSLATPMSVLSNKTDKFGTSMPENLSNACCPGSPSSRKTDINEKFPAKDSVRIFGVDFGQLEASGSNDQRKIPKRNSKRLKLQTDRSQVQPRNAEEIPIEEKLLEFATSSTAELIETLQTKNDPNKLP
jgi:hypothetical protein